MEKLGSALGTIVITLAIAAVFLAWPVQWLWNNCLVGAMDGVHELSFWQAMGINFLCSILFKNSTPSK